MGTSSSRHKSRNISKSQTSTEQKSEFDIFLKSWRAEITEFSTKFDELSPEGYKIIKDIYNNLTKCDISKKYIIKLLKVMNH